MTGGFEFIISRLPELCLRTGEHVILTGIATVVALTLGVPLGIVTSRVSWLKTPLMSAVGILQTIPSLAMLALLLALLGRIGVVPAVIALTLYALLPIVRNTVTGIEGVPAGVVEAAYGLGMTQFQQLRIVQLPLALPVIVAGLRTASVVGVGIATLSAFIGAGGLGQFINRGLALSNTRLILLGAIPAAVLALCVDFAIAASEWSLQPTRYARARSFLQRLRPIALVAPLLLFAAGVAAFWAGARLTGAVRNHDGGQAPVRIGSKNFTEQLILGELMAQAIEDKTDILVERRFNLGGTLICHGALVNGEIDLYAEYTGTALTAILGEPTPKEPEGVFDQVARAYRDTFRAEWLSPFGFNNTYAITVRKADAEKNDWKSVSDLAASASSLRAGFTSEFSERPDGYPGLKKAYRFEFGETTDLDPSILYEAIAREELDVICAFATDGRIAAYDLVPLEDDRGFFPPYHAAPVMRMPSLRIHPELRDVLSLLGGRLDDAAMQQMNYEVDQNKRTPRAVAREFLEAQGLTKKES